MRGVITCLAIVYLTLASGAPTDEESKAYTKSHYFDKGDVINTITPFWKDEVVYAVCEGADADKKCKVYVESINQGESIVQSCDLDLKYSGRFDGNMLLTNAGNSKAVLVVRDGDTKAKLISVNLKGCQIKEASIDVSPIHLYYFGYSFVIVPHENKYDVLFPNKQLCNDFLCKATFDYEGKLVKAASSFPIKYLNSNIYKISYGNNAYVVAESADSSTNVYLVKDDDNQTKTTLFGAAQKLPYFTGLSTEENKFGLCAIADEKIVCKQYDVEGKIKKIETETSSIGDKLHTIQYLDILNLENGFLALSIGDKRSKNSLFISIAHFDEQGKQNKSITIDSKCEDHLVFAKLYKNTSGQYCVNSIYMKTFDNENRSRFSLSNRCFLKTELF